MKFIVAKNVIQKALQNVSGAVESRPTVNICGFVKISAKDGQVSLTTTNLDMWASDTFNCEVEASGEAAVSMTVLLEIVKRLPSDIDISCELIGDKLHVSSGSKSSFEVSTTQVAEFPDIVSESFTDSFETQSKSISDVIKRTAFSISTDVSRQNLTGLLLHTKVNSENKTILQAVSTDGHRLSCMSLDLKEEDLKLANKIVPRKALTEIGKLLPQADVVKFSFSDTSMRAQVGSVIFTTKLIDGSYPDYERVVPKNNTKILEVDRTELIAALSRVSVVYQLKGTRGVSFDVSEGKLNLKAVNSNGDMARETTDAKFSEAESFHVSCNPIFVSDILAANDGNTIRFCFSDASAPFLMQSVDNNNYYHVVMPMRF